MSAHYFHIFKESKLINDTRDLCLSYDNKILKHKANIGCLTNKCHLTAEFLSKIPVPPPRKKYSISFSHAFSTSDPLLLACFVDTWDSPEDTRNNYFIRPFKSQKRIQDCINQEVFIFFFGKYPSTSFRVTNLQVIWNERSKDHETIRWINIDHELWSTVNCGKIINELHLVQTGKLSQQKQTKF